MTSASRDGDAAPELCYAVLHMPRNIRLAAVVLCASLVTLGAACGSGSSDRAAIQAALVRSPLSYFHYRSPVWWGARVQPRLDGVTYDSGFAVARASIPAGTLRPHGYRTQWALLVRRSSTWRLLDVVYGRSSFLPCRAGPRVMKALAGGCAGHQPSHEGGVIFGPGSSPGALNRDATPAEQRGLVAAATRQIGLPARNGCVIFDPGSMFISKINPRYGFLSYGPQPQGRPYYPQTQTKCRHFFGNGDGIFERTGGVWSYIGHGEYGLPCESAPPGVLRSLIGFCLTL